MFDVREFILVQYISVLLQNNLALDGISAAIELFQIANAISSARHYVVTSCALDEEPVDPSHNWTKLSATYALASLPAEVDTLILPPLNDSDIDPELPAVLRGYLHRFRRIIALGNGVLLAAAAGAAFGRHVATCPDLVARLEAHDGSAIAVTDKIWHRDGSLFTAVDAIAATELFLEIVREDFGPVAEVRVRHIVEERKRSVDALQRQKPGQASDGKPAVERIVDWVKANPSSDLSLAALARMVAMTERTLSRNFKQRVGTTVGDFVLSVRLEHARKTLTNSDLTIKTVASRCGLGSPENMRRLFQERFGCSPGAYRQQHRVERTLSFGTADLSPRQRRNERKADRTGAS